MKRRNGSADAAELFAQSKYSHDPHCYVRVDWWYGVPAGVCQCCKSIASARADEREQAAQRVWAAAKKANGAWATPILSLEAVAAARGETCQADGIDGPSTRSSHASDNAAAREGER